MVVKHTVLNSSVTEALPLSVVNMLALNICTWLTPNAAKPSVFARSLAARPSFLQGNEILAKGMTL
jgi:hypothetical protein